MNSIKFIRLGKVIERNTEQISIDDNQTYKQVTVRLWCKGVQLRNEVKGHEIKSAKRFIVKPNQFIISKIDARNGASGLIPEELNGAVITGDFLSFNCKEDLILPEYLYWLSKTNWFIEQCVKASSGTTNRVRLNDKKFMEIEIPLPNIEQQKEVIRKINGVVGTINEIESELIQQNELAIELEKAILYQAIQGQIVEQDPNDEPALELLKKLQLEKERQIREKIIKKEKKSYPISEIPYELPKGWEWVRINQIGELSRGKSKHRPRNDERLYKDGIYPFVQTGDVARSNGLIETYSNMYNDVGLQQSRLWPKGTLCITIAANIADTGILNFDACFPDSVVGFIPFKPIQSAEYLQYFFMVAKDDLIKYAPSTAQKNINLEILNNLVIPLPPLNEMLRIISTVKSLMVKCERLKVYIESNLKNCELLLQKTLQEVLQLDQQKEEVLV